MLNDRKLEEKLGATECESRNVKAQWNNITKCVLHTMSDLTGKQKSKKAMDYKGNDQKNK
jgi:hypothetical protein